MLLNRLVCAVVVSLTLIAGVRAADEATIRIEISKLHCSSCAKRVAKKLQAVSNVKAVTVEVKTSQATITAAKDKKPSPKALWEAVEATGYKPLKLIAPDATYKEKPKA